MRVTATALPNRRGPGFRWGIWLANSRFAGRSFAVLLDRVDALNVSEDHRLNISIFFVVKHGRDSGPTFVFFCFFLGFVFFSRAVERLVRNFSHGFRDDSMSCHVFFRQRWRGGFGGFNDGLRNFGNGYRQRYFRRGRFGAMGGSIGQCVFGGVMNRLLKLFDCLDYVGLNCDRRPSEPAESLGIS